MAEPKRVPLLPVKPVTTNGEASSPSRDDQASTKIKDDDGESIRLELCLSDSTERGCPEFSYLQKIKEKVKKNTDQLNKLDPLDKDDSGQLEALAKKFEDKYGPKSDASGKKRKHDTNPLFYDIGYGYDDTDPFVDNSEAYDELIPSNWTTQHGGFYINQGELHYRQQSDIDSKDFKSPKKKKLSENKKLKIKHADKSLSRTPKELSTQKRKKQLLSKEKRQKKLEHAVILEKEKKEKKKTKLFAAQNHLQSSEKAKIGESVPFPKKSKQQNDTLSHSVNNSVYNESSLLTPPDAKNLKQTFVKLENLPVVKSDPDKVLVNNEDLLARQKFVKDALAHASTSDDQACFTSPNKPDNNKKSTDISPSTKELTKDGEPLGPPQLPDNLPLILEAGIQNLKEAALNCSNGKCRFFDVSVNKTLLGVARTLAKLPCKVRTNTYDYLAYYLPCSKDTLVKRAKTLMIEHQVNQLDEPLVKLKDAIERVMPQQKKMFDAAVANALTEQVREQMKQSGFPSKTDIETTEHQPSIASLYLSDFRRDQPVNESQDNLNSSEQPMTPTEANGKKNIPKRKFSWSEEIRNLLCEVVTVKVQLFKMSKSRSMTAEEYIKDFLENDVRKLWPKGWMTSRILFKESKTAHQEVTQQISKTKKILKKPDQTGTLKTLQQDTSKSSSNLLPPASSNLDPSPKLSQKTSESAVLQFSTKSSSLPKTAKSTQVKAAKNTGNRPLPIPTDFKPKFSENRDKSSIMANQPHHAKSSSHEVFGSQSVTASKKESHYLTPESSQQRTMPAFPKPGDIYSNFDNEQSVKSSPASYNARSYASVISEKPAVNLDESIRSILDYATGSSNTGKQDFSSPPKVPKIASGTQQVKIQSEKCIALQRKECSLGNAHSSKSTTSNNELVWNSKSSTPREFSHSITSPSRSLSTQPVKLISPPRLQAHSDAALKQSSQQNSAKVIYKTPPNESQRSKSTTPPKHTLKNTSPHRSASAASSRTSPLVHFPTGLEHTRRLSGHSPEEIQRSQIGLSHSVSRMTNDSPNKSSTVPISQQASFESMPFSNALSSFSNVLASSNHPTQSFSQVHEQMQKMAAKQAKQLPSQVDLLFQQQQLQHHLKQQTLLQQQQQQQHLQKQQLQQHIPNMANSSLLENQGPYPMDVTFSIPNMLHGTDQIVFSSPLNSFNPFNSLQGSSTASERYPNPFPNYRPQFS